MYIIPHEQNYVNKLMTRIYYFALLVLRPPFVRRMLSMPPKMAIR